LDKPSIRDEGYVGYKFVAEETNERVWFEDEVGWDMAIHGYWDKDIHDACLVGWMGRTIFLFG